MKSREFGKSLQPSIFYTQVGQVDPVLGVVWCDVVLWILDKNGSHLEMAQKNTKNLRHSENQHFSEKNSDRPEEASSIPHPLSFSAKFLLTISIFRAFEYENLWLELVKLVFVMHDVKMTKLDLLGSRRRKLYQVYHKCQNHTWARKN